LRLSCGGEHGRGFQQSYFGGSTGGESTSSDTHELTARPRIISHEKTS
jgi:hypothetical protein